MVGSESDTIITYKVYCSRGRGFRLRSCYRPPAQLK